MVVGLDSRRTDLILSTNQITTLSRFHFKRWVLKGYLKMGEAESPSTLLSHPPTTHSTTMNDKLLLKSELLWRCFTTSHAVMEASELELLKLHHTRNGSFNFPHPCTTAPFIKLGKKVF